MGMRIQKRLSKSEHHLLPTSEIVPLPHSLRHEELLVKISSMGIKRQLGATERDPRGLEAWQAHWRCQKSIVRNSIFLHREALSNIPWIWIGSPGWLLCLTIPCPSSLPHFIPICPGICLVKNECAQVIYLKHKSNSVSFRSSN